MTTTKKTDSIMDAVNRQTMAVSVVEYQWSSELENREKAALRTVIDKVKDQPILDLGVGAGRTVKGLLDVSRNYTGVDYVPEMVEHCRKAFPDVRFEHGDARSMPQFADGSFALVFFSCCGLGMVDHEGRMAILREVHRLLKPGGHFIFNTANLSSPDALRMLLLPPFTWSWMPPKTLVRSVRFLAQTALRAANRIRHKRHEFHAPSYAILNDVCHHYGTFAYFITLENQRRQLEEAGFRSDAPVFDLLGRPVLTDSNDGSLTFVAERRG